MWNVVEHIALELTQPDKYGPKLVYARPILGDDGEAPKNLVECVAHLHERSEHYSQLGVGREEQRRENHVGQDDVELVEYRQPQVEDREVQKQPIVVLTYPIEYCNKVRKRRQEGRGDDRVPHCHEIAPCGFPSSL